MTLRRKSRSLPLWELDGAKRQTTRRMKLTPDYGENRVPPRRR